MGNLRTSALINVVDDQDVPVRVTNRNRLPIEHSNFRVVHVMVRDRLGRIVLQKIAGNQRSAGKLGSSAAGYVLASEGYGEASIRKLEEELGLTSLAPRLVCKVSMRDLGATKFISVFEAVSEGPFVIDRAQIAEVRLATLEDIGSEIDVAAATFTRTFRHIWPHYLANTSIR